MQRSLKQIPDATVHRLSLYYRVLDILEQNHVETTSSQRIGSIEGIAGAQVRRDLSHFGSFGKRGVGYNVTSLKREISKILGFDWTWKIALIGAVQFSTVLMNSSIFRKKNFIITKIFDNTPGLIGRKIGNITISDMQNLEKELDIKKVDLAIVAVPPPEVQSIIDRLGKIGIKGILYFASRSINVPKDLVVRNQDISIELGTITFHITHKSGNKKRRRPHKVIKRKAVHKKLKK